MKLNNYHTTSFWQSIKKPSEINVKISSDGTAVQRSGILAVLYDRDALGLYKKDSWNSTTPFNSAGGYYNTYYHHKELYFNDLSENFVVFVIADE